MMIKLKVVTVQMNEVELMEKTLAEYKHAQRLKNLNKELYEHLIGSMYWLLKYSEKYSVSLPKKEQMWAMIEKADFIIDQTKPHQPTFDSNKNNRRFDRTVN